MTTEFQSAAINAFNAIRLGAKKVAEIQTDGLFLELEDYGLPAQAHPDVKRKTLMSAETPALPESFSLAKQLLQGAAFKYAFLGPRAVVHTLGGIPDDEIDIHPVEFLPETTINAGTTDNRELVSLAIQILFEKAAQNGVKGIPDRVTAIYPSKSEARSWQFPEEVDGIEVFSWPVPKADLVKDAYILTPKAPFEYVEDVDLVVEDNQFVVVYRSKIQCVRPWAIVRIRT